MSPRYETMGDPVNLLMGLSGGIKATLTQFDQVYNKAADDGYDLLSMVSH